MKKIIITVLLLGALLIPPLVLAQEQIQPYSGQDSGQAQIYSGFGRFIDNVKMFFSFGNKKIMLALDIREKELNSAIINTKNGENKKAEKNLERAKKKLQYIQKKVSKNIAEVVKTNIDKTINKINIEENLPNSFETYILEEEKTQLIAELVIEVEGKEDQTLTREIVKDSESGKKKIEIVVEGVEEGNKQTKVMEIEVKIGEIDNQIRYNNQIRKIEMDMTGDNVINEGTNVIESGMNIDMDKIDPDATPKTPVPTDGAICCKKTINGKAQYHWDPEDVCLNPKNIAGAVVNDDSCLALGDAINDEDEVITEGVPEECVSQGVYDIEGCGRIMEMVEICCRKTIDGEVKYEWVPGKICVSPYGDRVDGNLCLN